MHFDFLGWNWAGTLTRIWRSLYALFIREKQGVGLDKRLGRIRSSTLHKCFVLFYFFSSKYLILPLLAIYYKISFGYTSWRGSLKASRFNNLVDSWSLRLLLNKYSCCIVFRLLLLFYCRRLNPQVYFQIIIDVISLFRLNYQGVECHSDRNL
jgi:hypothetical protein